MSDGDRGGQLRRMILLMTVLSSAESPMSAEELAAALECESRTARRDLEVLRECGVEVLTITEGRRVAYRARPLLLMTDAPCACGCDRPVRRPIAEIRVVPRTGGARTGSRMRRYARAACREYAHRERQREARGVPAYQPPVRCRDCDADLPATDGRPGRPPVRCDACRVARRGTTTPGPPGPGAP